VFRGGARGELVLGAAWAAPPASLQPVIYEPPYSAMCLPGGRGDGSIADDVYALGVVLIALAMGRMPLAGLEEEAVLRRKLALGSYEALTAGEPLPPPIADVIRGMLAEDPEHRPAPATLADLAAAPALRRPVSTPRRAQRAFEIGGIEAWDARAVAYAIAKQPAVAAPVLNTGALDLWLRRSLGEATLADRLEEAATEQRHMRAKQPHVAKDVLATVVVALLDPLAPLCWQGVSWWPDGLGPALADAQGANSEVAGKLGESVAAEAALSWAGARRHRCDEPLLRIEARQNRALLRERETTAGLDRLLYGLNPLLPCASPLIQKRSVVGMADLLVALEALSDTVDRKAGPPLDMHMAAFVAARAEPVFETGFNTGVAEHADAVMQLRVLARLQAQFHPGPLPGLAGWLAAHAAPTLGSLRSRTRRALTQERLETTAAAGHLQAMLDLIDDHTNQAADAREADEAARALARIDGELRMIEAGGEARAKLARCFGQELAAGSALAAVVIVLLAAAFG
jgi:eukaryotic-like serine/threonine-protein kinase